MPRPSRARLELQCQSCGRPFLVGPNQSERRFCSQACYGASNIKPQRTDGLKACSACQETKPLEHFPRNRSRKDGYGEQCKLCNNARSAQWQKEHRQRYLARLARWANDHQDELKAKRKEAYWVDPAASNAQSKAYREAHPDQHKEYHKKKWAANGERYRAAKRKHYDEHREDSTAQRRQWRRDNPQKQQALDRVHGALRRARECSAEGVFNKADIERILVRQQGLCFYCSVPLETGYHIEHKQPLSRGGTNWPANIALACARCNHRKRNKTVEEFMAYLTHC